MGESLAAEVEAVELVEVVVGIRGADVAESMLDCRTRTHQRCVRVDRCLFSQLHQ
jgi:hypothetical protein